jgi:hypothetical protein
LITSEAPDSFLRIFSSNKKIICSACVESNLDREEKREQGKPAKERKEPMSGKGKGGGHKG